MQPVELAILSVTLLAASFTDITKRRVPNILVGTGFLSLFFVRTVFNIEALGDFMLGSIYPLALLSLLFIFGMMGAGDIKLFALCGAVTGVSEFKFLLFFSLILGASFALIKMVYKKNLVIRMQYLATYFTGLFQTRTITPYYVKEEDDGNAISFAVFIFLGFMLYLYWRCFVNEINIGGL